MMNTINTIKCIAFDLDDTLIDTTRLIIPEAAKNACQALIDGGASITLYECNRLRHEMAKKYSHRDIFKMLGKQYGVLNLEYIEKAIDCFYKPQLDDFIPIFSDAKNNLILLKKKKYHLYLVTSGDLEAQKKKIKATQVASFFEDLFIVENNLGKRKKEVFEQIISKNKIMPAQLLSFGNRIHSEIRDAKLCGATTCHFAYGEHLGEVLEQPEDYPDYTVSEHKDFISVCNL